ncbi:MAG: bifunctional (p)ppGpp synthetase/guanosine-3',5'-bis(diphosphate) 3'-pyrophosphohydrolase [Bacteroidaceae bacterium]|nr:bifunctional (p)ppGpp synthetase/guanosine-3',5'-bis(diphosphate) 3'-pyrophosphohydrolase [Bacteroidaceae bacterium]
MAMDDEKLIQEAYQHLIDTYLASPHRKKVSVIERAFKFACQAHQGVRRLSGEPYIMHPLAVAQIVCGEIGLGSTSICAALLHDVVEDTDYTVEDISNIFGEKIARIVDGVTKISGGIFGSQASAQAETFKKLLLTMSNDIRVILIKISDRLHNMRTLGSQLPAKQYKITGETLYIYAPLANRLGLNKIKEELEDLSFRYEHPEQYTLIKNRLADLNQHLKDLFDEFTAPIRERMDQTNLKYTIKARIKSPYSIWNKMQNKKVTLDEIYDILAARIIFDGDGNQENEITDCWRIYAIATNIYRPHPERLRDWLSHPKANGYQALQTTLMSKGGRWIELQIRSRRMDEIAEQGFAAHWKYKDGDKTHQESENELDRWLSTIKEILDDPQPNAMDFLDAIKLNLYANEIVVVTPKGEFKTMPAGCTALDFAFSVHTSLGTHCIGAKVNHRLVPLSYKLESGDQVEILTGRNVLVSTEWLNFITTAKARTKIHAILRRQYRQKQKEGEEMLLAFLKEHDLPSEGVAQDRLALYHHLENREQLHVQIASKMIVLGDDDVKLLKDKSSNQKWRRFIPFLKKNTATNEELFERERNAISTAQQPPATESSKQSSVDRRKTLILTEDSISRYVICEHCHPIPGDDVLAYHDVEGYITIHKRKCPIADRLKAVEGNNILAAKWDTHKVLYFPAVLHVEGIDRIGVLHQITGVLSQQMNVNISSLNVSTDNGIFVADVVMMVHDLQDLKEIIRDIKKIKEIEKVVRTG